MFLYLISLFTYYEYVIQLFFIITLLTFLNKQYDYDNVLKRVIGYYDVCLVCF